MSDRAADPPGYRAETGAKVGGDHVFGQFDAEKGDAPTLHEMSEQYKGLLTSALRD